jgi:Cupin-like domain
MDISNKVPERAGVTRAIFEEEIVPAGKPVLMQGLVADWPVVRDARASTDSLANYLKQIDSGAGVETFVGKPEMRGRYFYNADMSGFNFEKGATSLSNIVDQLFKMPPDNPPLMIYAGSAPTSESAPQFRIDNPMPLLDSGIEPRLWLGNSSRVAAHYDNSRNIACCIAGKRRFTLFPPDQIGNLYLGPLEFTMAGPPASMVDLHAPDYARYPKFAEAEKAAMVADMEPGDALYMPSLWLHHVEAEGPFNLLANYWWMPKNAGSVFEAMMLAMIDLRDQTPDDKVAWRAYFDHFVFDDDAHKAAAHLPEKLGTAAGAKTPQRDAMVLSFVKDRLQRRKN